MTNVLTLIAAPGATHLTEAAVGELVASHPDLNAAAKPPHWLAAGEACACELGSLEPATHDDFNNALSPLARRLKIDVAITQCDPTARRKKLLIADMESTIICEELIDELANKTGMGPKIADVTARAMRGELDFASALEQRVAHFEGLDAKLLDDLYEDRVTLMPGAETLVKTMRSNGAFCALVSGGFTVFTSRIAERLGFDTHRGNTLEVSGGKLTGRVVAPILGRNAKAEALNEFVNEQRLSKEATLAVGDGANDLEMIGAAGLGVAFRAKPVLAKAADVAITHGDLTALLYLQGYRRDEFVT